MTGTGVAIDYSAWDHIDISDDDDVTNPYVDTPSLFRMRHRARLEKMAGFQQRGEDLESNLAECGRLLEEAERRLRAMEERKTEVEEANLTSVRAEVKKLKKDKRLFEKMREQHKREEKRLPWNVDTISKDGFSRSIVNVKPNEETQEEGVEKYGEEIKHFGMLRRYDDSQKYLSDNPHLVCEETANRLVVICIECAIDEKHALMEQVAHQAIVMHSILDLGRALKADPRGCFRQFFSSMKNADQLNREAFQRELDLLKERVRSCARMRMEDAREELEEEEKQKRLGPGGLDPVEVYESLPKDMQRSFDEKNIEMLHEAMAKLDLEVSRWMVDDDDVMMTWWSPQEGKYHLARCIDSGLWVPETKENEGYGEDEEED
ncbi:hsp90 co-chaperone Cdc37 isoform X1 [Syngnathus scovelli]|uniref:hsp90 co-chaperone Cdc37 isoform X1 n=1 Tax=Syngnathus scovelli TaxID=161590 RepID=UPI0021107E92|nr:hsp90 co-chaperone Cdc37 isoform X1 [Syngnathus scovelli]